MTPSAHPPNRRPPRPARCAQLVLSGAAALILAACLGGDGRRTVDCGGGDYLAYEGSDVCIMQSALIIEGFDCPEAVPYSFEAGGDGAVICASDSDLDDDDVERILDRWGGVIYSDTRSSDTSAPQDTAPAQDTFIPADTGPLPPVGPTACEQAHALGGYVDVGEELCLQVEGCGGAALVVDCTAGRLLCDCVRGEQVCRVADGCAERDQAVDQACNPLLGDRACVDGASCTQPTPTSGATCEPLPDLCDPGGCLFHEDCPAGALCVAADPWAAGGAQLGVCAAAPAPDRCWSVGHCPADWRCDNPLTGCDACGCDPETDGATPGTCDSQQATSIGLDLAPLDGARGELASGVTARWAVPTLASGSIWVPCPSFTLELRDETTASYRDVALDATCDAGLAELAPGDVVVRVSGTPSDIGDALARGYARVRLSGRYYTGCAAGQGVESCDGGAVELVSEPVVISASP